jgi:hypothetical protein
MSASAPTMGQRLGPYMKTFGPALLALGQLIYALKTNGSVTEGELKTFGALALAAFSAWALPAPNYSAPGQVAVDQNDPRLRPADGGYPEQPPTRSSSSQHYPSRTIRDIEDTPLPEPQREYGYKDREGF